MTERPTSPTNSPQSVRSGSEDVQSDSSSKTTTQFRYEITEALMEVERAARFALPCVDRNATLAVSTLEGALAKLEDVRKEARQAGH
jgi:hypothetical protein